MAGSLFTFVGKHKAHPGAVWEGSRETVWFFVKCSLREMLIRPRKGCAHQASGFTKVSKFSA